MCRQYLFGRLLYPGQVKSKGSVTFGGQTSCVLSDFILRGGSGCTQANKLGDAQMANCISTRACAVNLMTQPGWQSGSQGLSSSTAV